MTMQSIREARKRRQAAREFMRELKERLAQERACHLAVVDVTGAAFPFCEYGEDDWPVLKLKLLDPAQLVWVPLRQQCAKCHRELLHHHGHGAPDVDYKTCDTHSATPLMITAIEIAMHAWGDFCRTVDATGTHADRGCYFRFDQHDSPRCWCGAGSWTFWPYHPMWLEAVGDNLLRSIGWWPEHEWRRSDGDEYIVVRIGGVDPTGKVAR